MFYIKYRTNYPVFENVGEEASKIFLENLNLRYSFAFKNVKKTSDILVNLEKRFHVSSKNKSLFHYLVKDPECPKERNYPLRRRIGIKMLK